MGRHKQSHVLVHSSCMEPLVDHESWYFNRYDDFLWAGQPRTLGSVPEQEQEIICSPPKRQDGPWNSSIPCIWQQDFILRQ